MAKIEVDTSELSAFFDKCLKAGNGDLKKEFDLFLEGIGMDFLRIIQDEIISKEVKDTRDLLASFQKGENDNVWIHNSGALTLEVGTNVQYAKYVNDGHWQNRRFIPGDVVIGKDGKVKEFKYNPSAKTGIMLTAKRVEGKHYWESGIKIIEAMLPKFLDAKIQQWLEQYFSR